MLKRSLRLIEGHIVGSNNTKISDLDIISTFNAIPMKH